jgi:large subunit ribosomal protein L15
MALRLHNLRNRPGARHRRKRVGSGESSGHGKTSTRGGKGQTARTGGSIRPGFEGGQMPLIRRLPKRGFNNAAFATEYAVVNVEQLNRFDDGAEVNPAVLVEKRIVRRLLDGVKVLGTGELKKKLTVKAHRFSASAKEKIAKAGGQCEVIQVQSKRAPSASPDQPTPSAEPPKPTS